MEIYKIESPTTKQLFDAIINDEYVPLEKLKPKAKQVLVLLKDYYCTKNIFITFTHVTNSGGVPYFFTDSCDFFELASTIDSEFIDMEEGEQSNFMELLSCYIRKYEDIFEI